VHHDLGTAGLERVAAGEYLGTGTARAAVATACGIAERQDDNLDHR
jgi:hypothetical protein